jgi:hypothetical protein
MSEYGFCADKCESPPFVKYYNHSLLRDQLLFAAKQTAKNF